MTKGNKKAAERRKASEFIAFISTCGNFFQFLPIYFNISPFIATYRHLSPFIAIYRHLSPFIAFYRQEGLGDKLHYRPEGLGDNRHLSPFIAMSIATYRNLSPLRLFFFDFRLWDVLYAWCLLQFSLWLKTAWRQHSLDVLFEFFQQSELSLYMFGNCLRTRLFIIIKSTPCNNSMMLNIFTSIQSMGWPA